MGALGTTHAAAFTVTDDLEVIVTPSVGSAFVTVPFENTYSNPVPVCTHRLPSASQPSAVVRIDSLGSASMRIRLQQMPSSSVVPVTDVHCIIADAGAYNAGGLKFEARRVVSTGTQGNNAADGWAQNDYENVTGLVTQTYSAPAVLGQVITFNDSRASVYTNSDCENRGNRPFDSGFSDGICVSKHIGELSGSRSNETLGFIVVETGSGTVNGIDFQAAVGPDNVAGVGNSPPYTYSVSGDFEAGVVTQAEEAGGQGGWAVLYGSDPLPNNGLRIAIDEEVVAGDTSRTHTREPVAFWVFDRRAALTIEKTASFIQGMAPAGAGDIIRYTYVVTNTGRAPVSNVQVTDVHEGLGSFPDNPPNAALTDNAPLGDSAGTIGADIWTTLGPGDIVTFFADYQVVQDDIDLLQ